MSESNTAGQKSPESSPALSAVESRDLLSAAQKRQVKILDAAISDLKYLTFAGPRMAIDKLERMKAQLVRGDFREMEPEDNA